MKCKKVVSVVTDDVIECISVRHNSFSYQHLGFYANTNTIIDNSTNNSVLRCTYDTFHKWGIAIKIITEVTYTTLGRNSSIDKHTHTHAYAHTHDNNITN